MKLRIGLIGQSRDWKTVYGPLLMQMRDRYEVRSVYNSVAALADQVAHQFDADSEASFRSMVARPDIDAVIALESDWYGALPIYAACDAGKAVFCGSDVQLDSSTMEEVRQRVSDSGIAFISELPRRFAPATVRLKELIATRLGEPRLLFCHRRLPHDSIEVEKSANALQTRSERELVELVDWCRFLVGEEPTWVQGIRHPFIQNPSVSNYQVVSLGFGDPERESDSVLAQISCGAYIPAQWHEAIAFRPPAAIQVCCTNGLAFVDLPTSLVWFDSAGRHQESLDHEPSGCQMLLQQFHRSVTSPVQRVENLNDIYVAINIVSLARESMLAAQRMHLPAKSQ
jgi:predicted dehydrogenase